MRIPATVPFIFGVLVFVHGALQAQVTPPARPSGQLPLAAAPGRLIGAVQNAEGQPLAAVAITVRSGADSSIVTGVLSDKSGRFRVDGLPLGGYTIRVSLVGHKPRSSEVVNLTSDRATYDFGTIKLEVAPIQLDAVEAVAEKAAMVVEADRTVYNTKSMPAATGGNAIDLLKAVPELEVDINNNVKMRGNQSVTLQLNGRPMPFRSPEALANFLQQLPGNRVARVEVIPNPSARHDPESMGGIVNIVLEENVDLGLSGSVSVNASTRNQQGLGGRINYQRGRLTLFTGLHGSLFQGESRNYDLRQNLVGNPLTTIEQNSNSENENLGVFGDWTAELKVGRQATLYSSAWFSTSANDNAGFMQYGIFEDVTHVRDRYDRATLGEGAYEFLDGGLGFVQIFQPSKHELRIDARLNTGGNESQNRLTKEFLMAGGSPADLPIELTLSDNDSNNGNLSVQADYYRPVGKARWDLGYRAARRDQDYDNLLRIFETETAIDPMEQTHSAYQYDETFHSIYSTVARPIGKFNLQLGVRSEFAQTHFKSL
ncbi:MAG TPA: outer membrane beta-barrel protein, partial [Longimicrobiales bacterium]|nr:outer membrane beta-barrel protein [Longimicrobiales bacterium]